MPMVPRSRPGRRPLQLDGAVRRTVLPGGLQVVTEDIRSTNTYSLGVFAGVGSRHETSRLHGASHFLEHLLFKGTSTRSAEQISAAIEAVGGELNAYTAKEHTCFYARVLHSDAELALDVLTDMITNSLITPEDVDAERAVILDEISMHADDPTELAAEAAAAAIFGKSGLGRSVIGSRGSVASLSRRQIVQHWRRHYRPSSLVVAAAGKVDHDRLVQRLSAVDGQPAAAGPTAAEPRHDQPPQSERSRRSDHAPATTRAVQRGTGFPEFRHLRPTSVCAWAALPDRRRRYGLPPLRRGAGAARPELQHRCRGDGLFGRRSMERGVAVRAWQADGDSAAGTHSARRGCRARRQ